MATSKEYIDFILDQLSSLEGITFRKMMGEYIIYLNEKLRLMSAITGCL